MDELEVRRVDAWDGYGLLAAMRHSASLLQMRVDEVNALNVFPVPDGDTGSNMLATLLAAVEEAEEVPEPERTVARVASALSLGALMGARGNSGVILSQILRGLGDAVAGSEQIGGRELADALDQGCRAAFAAVAHPVEGTILTVARDAAGAAAGAVSLDGDLATVLSAAAAEASASVERTPTLLPILEQAGVVDAGGRGLELILVGALASVRGEPVPASVTGDGLAFPSFETEGDEFGYETVFVISPHDGTHLAPGEIRRRLDELGESVLVAGDERAVKIHIHNTRPDEVIAYGLSLGTLSRIVVENLDRRARNLRERLHEGEAGAVVSLVATQVASPSQVVAVVPGDGLARVFRTLGADAVVQGGAGANPSAGELAEAIRATGATEVILLPNNPNVRLAARQAGQLCPGVRFEVVPTRNAGEGVAAMLALDWTRGIERTAADMATAAGRVQTLQVTVAVRHARIGRRKVRNGDYIVLGPSDGLLATDPDRTTAILAAIGTLKPGYELLTIYRGHAVDHATADRLRDSLTAEVGDVEIELVDGGQPHYDFVISAE